MAQAFGVQTKLMSITKSLVVIWACAMLVLGAGTAKHLSGAESTSSARNAAVQQWFNKMDISNDGQLEEAELRRFIGAQLGPTDFNTGRKLDHAIEQVTEKLDGEDSGVTISVNELGHYLHTVLEGVKVSDWISHSLGLPMYAEAFRDNAISVLDFPLLVNDGGKLLETELMVTRVLHRQKIMRAMQRQMLGLGVEPGPISILQCSSSNKEPGSAPRVDLPSSSTAASAGSSCNQHVGSAALQPGTVHCVWVQPDNPGEPPAHKYVLERFAMHRPGATWEPAADLDDTVTTQFTDIVKHPGSYQYRVAAWNMQGRSAYVFSDEVVVMVERLSNAAAAAATRTAELDTDQSSLQQQPGQQWQPPLPQHVITWSDVSNEQLTAERDPVRLNDNAHDQCHVPTDCHKKATHQVASDTIALAHRQQQYHPQQQQQPAQLGEGVLREQPLQPQHGALDVAFAVIEGTHGSLQKHGGGTSALGINQPGGDCNGLPNDLMRHASGPGSSMCSSCCSAHTAAANAPADYQISCNNGNSWNPSNTLNAADADTCGTNVVAVPASSAAAATAGLSPATAAPNIVWVLGQDALSDMSPSTPAGIVAQAHLLRSMQAAAGVAVSEAAGQGGQANIGQSHVGQSTGSSGKKSAGSWSVAAIVAAYLGRWLKTLVNSVLLLVLPACVRLLPVPVLHQLPAAFARVLQWLPLPVRRAVRKVGAAPGVEQQHEGTDTEAAPVQRCSRVPMSAPFEGVLKTLPYNRPSSQYLSNGVAGAAAVNNNSPVDLCGVLTAGSSQPLASGCAGAAMARTAAPVPAETGPSLVNSPSREDLEKFGITAALDFSMQKPTRMAKSTSEVGLVRLWPSSPASSTTGQQLVPAGPAAAKSGSAAATAGPYEGIYGFAWQTGPITGSAAAQETFRAAPEVQAMYAAMAPESARQQQQEGSSRALMEAATVQGWHGGSSHSGSCYVPEELVVNSRMPNRKRCALPGCNQQFDLRHLRALMQRHYCGHCQQVFCLAHTAYSPHGAGRGCGAESRCVCCSCIFNFTPEYRMFLMSRNTLQNNGGRRTRSGPPAGRGSSDNEGSCSLAGMQVDSARMSVPHRFYAASKSSPALQHAQQHVQAAGRSQLGLSCSSDSFLNPEAAACVSRFNRKARVAAGPAAAADLKQMKSRMLWSRAWTKATAVVRLSHGGQLRHEQERVVH